MEAKVIDAKDRKTLKQMYLGAIENFLDLFRINATSENTKNHGHLVNLYRGIDTHFAGGGYEATNIDELREVVKTITKMLNHGFPSQLHDLVDLKSAMERLLEFHERLKGPQNIEVGDWVDVMWEHIPHERGVEVMYLPCQTGDSWHLRRLDGTMINVGIFSKMVKTERPRGPF